MITTLLLIAAALLFTVIAGAYFININNKTNQLTKKPKDEPQIKNSEEN